MAFRSNFFAGANSAGGSDDPFGDTRAAFETAYKDKAGSEVTLERLAAGVGMTPVKVASDITHNTFIKPGLSG